MKRFEDKVAIVTGCGRGVGRAVALGLAREGAKIVINDIDEEPAQETLKMVQEVGSEGLIHLASVTDRPGVQGMVDKVVEKWGTIHILINNAGILRTSMITRMTEDDWDAVVDTHLKGMFNCLQAVGRVMIERAKTTPEAVSNGKIVNITSVAGMRGTVGQINYGSAKAGIIGLTMSAAREWARYRINVNAVGFGIVATRMTETLRTDPRFQQQYLEQIPWRLYGTPELVAPSVVFLAAPDSDYITGQTLSVCGGMCIHF